MMQSGNSDFTTQIGDFISAFTSDLNYGFDDPEFKIPPLRVAQMEVATTTMTVINSSNTVGLPPDFLQLRRFYLTGSPIQKLTYVTPNQMDSALASQPVGPPVFFTIMGRAIVLPAAVNTSQTLVGGYYARISELSSSNTVNWLLTADPWLYHAGACWRASMFIGDDDNTARWARVVAAKIRSWQGQDMKARYNGDALQIKTDVWNP